MKIFLAVFCVCLFPWYAFAHPGKTDYRGGHKCWKNCSGWELRRGEYHLHDEDWNPVRLDSNGEAAETVRTRSVPVPEKRFLMDESAAGTAPGIQNAPEGKGAGQAIVQRRHIVTVSEESLLPLHDIFLLLLAVLLLMVLIYVRKKKEREQNL